MAKVILDNRKITVQPRRFDIVINRSLARVLGNHTYSSLTINDVSYDIESMVVSDTSITVLLSNDQYNLSGVVTAKVVFFRDDSKTEWRVVVDDLPPLERSATAEYDSNLLPTQSYVKRRGLNGTIVNRREVEYKDGVPTVRTRNERVETEKYPVNDLLVIGTKKSGKVQDDMNLLITKEVFYGETDIVAIYVGKRLVWESTVYKPF